jgi:hypothetical protein
LGGVEKVLLISLAEKNMSAVQLHKNWKVTVWPPRGNKKNESHAKLLPLATVHHDGREWVLNTTMPCSGIPFAERLPLAWSESVLFEPLIITGNQLTVGEMQTVVKNMRATVRAAQQAADAMSIAARTTKRGKARKGSSATKRTKTAKTKTKTKAAKTKKATSTKPIPSPLASPKGEGADLFCDPQTTLEHKNNSTAANKGRKPTKTKAKTKTRKSKRLAALDPDWLDEQESDSSSDEQANTNFLAEEEDEAEFLTALVVNSEDDIEEDEEEAELGQHPPEIATTASFL